MTRLLARRTLVAIAALPLLLIALVACGDKDDSGSTASATDGRQASGVAYTAGETVSASDLARRLASGFADTTTAHATIKADIGEMGSLTGEGDVSRAGGEPAAAMTLDSDSLGNDIEVRLVDGVVYAKVGQLSQGKFWKLDLSDQHGPLGELRSGLDPKAMLEKLQKAITSVTYLGAEDGLDHYQVDVAPHALAEEMGKGHMMGMAGSDVSSAPKAVTLDLWLDQDNRLNKLTADAGDLGSAELTLSDFDAEVEVEAPPADQVTEMPQFGGDMARLAG
jgi:hypothetical protein